MTLENWIESMETTKKQLTVFAYGLPLILIFFSVRSYFKHGSSIFSLTFIALAVIFVVIALLRKDWLKKIFHVWMAVVQRIGFVVTTVLMVVIFTVLFAPIGILLRILRKDLLDQRLEPQASSYWKKKEYVIAGKERYTYQY